eukprot:NODE_800_length_4111_cov_0.200598.p3 type:complete len:141 gc:universal NODE_800_length_4111_cov_0.200598:1205-1627(+)
MRKQIQAAFKLAFKSKDKVRLNTIKSINAKVQLLDKSKKLTDDEIVNVISKLIKEREDSIKQYTKANRMDLTEPELREKHILLEFMPTQLTKMEIESILEKMGDKPLRVIMKEFPYPSSLAPRSIIKELLDSKIRHKNKK